jgi:prolyl-tRNA editing enzyme YbaK/EbsC (Cys-tRNA(Pro) deacylase)
MMTMAEVIKRYLDGHGVDYKLHAANGPTMTAQDAATRLHAPLETIIKSILFTDEKQTPILAILTGDKRADRKKLASVIDQKVMSFSKVYGGSGTTEALMEIDPRDIARLTDAKVADISE